MSNLRRAMMGGELPITARNHSNLVGFYTMDNISGATLFDESPNSEDGTITGATAVSGKIGNALRFANAGDQVPCGDFADFGSSTDFTVVAWVKISDATKNKTVVAKRDGVGPKGWFLAVFTSGIVATTASDSVNQASALGTTAVNDGAYHMVVGVWDRSGNTHVEIDNGSAEGATSMASVGDLSSAGEVTIGNKSPTDTSGTSVTNMIGDEDHIRIFNKLLTAAEKTTLYNAGAGA